LTTALAVAQNIHAAAGAAKTLGRSQQIIFAVVAIQVNGNAIDRLGLLVLEVKPDSSANVRRHTDRSCALGLESPGRFRTVLGMSNAADGRSNDRENQDEPDEPHVA